MTEQNLEELKRNAEAREKMLSQQIGMLENERIKIANERVNYENKLLLKSAEEKLDEKYRLFFNLLENIFVPVTNVKYSETSHQSLLQKLSQGMFIKISELPSQFCLGQYFTGFHSKNKSCFMGQIPLKLRTDGSLQPDSIICQNYEERVGSEDSWLRESVETFHFCVRPVNLDYRREYGYDTTEEGDGYNRETFQLNGNPIMSAIFKKFTNLEILVKYEGEIK
jgi:hypothetical protein